MTARLRAVLTLLALGLPAQTIRAQTSVQPDREAAALMLALGDTLRIFAATSVPVEGVLAGVDSAAVAVQLPGMMATFSVPRAAITRIEVLRGHPRRGVAAVATGLLAGAAAGALFGGALTRGSYPNHEDDQLLVVAMGIAGSFVGAGTGLVIAFTRTDRWVPVDPQTLVLLETP